MNNLNINKKVSLSLFFTFFLIMTVFQNINASTRIKELVDIKGINDHQIVGYSLVVGLDGTGDSRRSSMTIQAVRNMMVKFGINVPQNNYALRNVASVMVTANVSPFARQGSKVDVVVSSMGDASSLEGGTLLMTPLIGKNNQLYAYAQGPMSIGGFNIETMSGERYRKNYALVGRVPNGGVVEKDLSIGFSETSEIDLLLRDPDFTSAVRIADAINSEFGNTAAKANDAGSVTVQMSGSESPVSMMARMEALEIDADQEARVVINERTGTVVVGQNVQLTPAAVAHGNLTIKVNSVPYVSQPPAFSGGNTVVVPQTTTEVTEDTGGNVAVFQNMASVEDLASMLNSLNVSSRDIIAIFQALKSAGSLKAKLVIM